MIRIINLGSKGLIILVMVLAVRANTPKFWVAEGLRDFVAFEKTGDVDALEDAQRMLMRYQSRTRTSPSQGQLVAQILGTIYKYQGEDLKGVREWRDQPAAATTLLNQGVVLLELGELRAATARFQLALDIDASIGDVYYYLGKVAFQEGDSSTALDFWKKALEKDFLVPSRKADLYYRFAVSHSGEQNWQQAVDYLHKALKIAPNHVNANVLTGQILYYAYHRAAGADVYFQRALQSKPDFVENYVRISKFLSEHGDSDRALSYCRAIPDKRQAHPSPVEYTCIADVHEKNGDLQIALNVLEAGLKVYPQSQIIRQMIERIENSYSPFPSPAEE